MTPAWPALLAYATLRMPLALLELPLFVLLPSFYGGTLGLDLALVGAVLFGVRLVDALADPAIGAATFVRLERTSRTSGKASTASHRRVLSRSIVRKVLLR